MIATYKLDSNNNVVKSGYTTPLRVLEDGDTFFQDLDKITKLLDAQFDQKVENIHSIRYNKEVSFDTNKKVQECIDNINSESTKCYDIEASVLSGISNLIEDKFIRCEDVFDLDPTDSEDSVGYVFDDVNFDRYTDYNALRSPYSDIDLKLQTLKTLEKIEKSLREGKELNNIELLDEVEFVQNIIDFSDSNNISCFDADSSNQDDFYKFVTFYQIYKGIKVVLDAKSRDRTLDEFHENILCAFDYNDKIEQFKMEIEDVFNELSYV